MGILSIRCSEEEKRSLTQACQKRGVSISEWVRFRVFETALPHAKRKIPEANQQLAIALNRIGGNLNQLARAVNSGKLSGWSEQDRAILAELNHQLDSTWRALQELQQGINPTDSETKQENVV